MSEWYTKNSETGGTAFPVVRIPVGDTAVYSAPGMTLRDYFAAAALQAAWDAKDKGYFDGGNEEVAACAYQIADAMIEQKRLREARP